MPNFWSRTEQQVRFIITFKRFMKIFMGQEPKIQNL